MTGTDADIAIIGGGIAGVSAAANLAPHATVVLLEAEDQLAHHTTGRSAAQLVEDYGGPVNQILTMSSRHELEHPPLPDTPPLLSPRGVLFVGGSDDAAALEAQAEAGQSFARSIERVGTAEVLEICPAIRADYATGGGVFEAEGADIDVMALHQSYIQRARAAGLTIERNARVTGLRHDAAGWRIRTAAGAELTATTVVNAAGSWGDQLAELAGLAPVGLSPLRRTAFTTAVRPEVPGAADSGGWPLVIAADETWYFKPEPGNHLLCSLADETLSSPCDAKPEELDVALAIERINGASHLGISSIGRPWAGLRTFASDRQPVAGFDDAAAGFFWLVGQGGCGIQSSAALGRATAGLILDGRLPDDLIDAGLTSEALGPSRFR
ncbi:MAG: FAD-binding oxidoreductase [Acidimicrobiales bacterium]|nr:FAD-binding oxidoreductase [Acidimicrobiales bacterium]